MPEAPPPDRSLAARRALAPTARPAPDRTAEARARLAALLAEVTALDAEVEGMGLELGAFAVELERRLGAVDGDLRRAAAIVRRLQALADGLALEVARLRADPGRRGRARRGARRRGPARGDPGAPGARADGGADGDGDDGAEAEPERRAADEEARPAVPSAERLAAELKQLYRRLARLLHPDLARDEPERLRLSGLMARVNAAYAAGDRTELELMAEKVGAGEPPGELSDEERVAHLARRVAQLERVGASLRRERERLLRSRTARLRAEAARRAAEGGDFFADELAALGGELEAARDDALERLDLLAGMARELSRERRGAMEELERRSGGGLRRRFDPLGESGIVRRSAARLDRARATSAARELARWLEEAASRAPWEAALTLLAFLIEAAGDRPPPAIADAAGLAGRWERLAERWEGAPQLAEALARAPRHLEVGARAGRAEVLAGLQLAGPDLAAGVSIALDREPVAAVAREVLAALGPEERCAGCRKRVLGRHLLRTHGLDELHGIACPRCGRILRSYWRYGEAEGLEALAPIALRLGLVGERAAALAGVAIGFQMLPEERAALTGRRLLALVDELYVRPCQVELPPGALRLGWRGRELDPGEVLPAAGTLSLRLTGGAGTTEDGLLELLRTRIERRFRPGGVGAPE